MPGPTKPTPPPTTSTAVPTTTVGGHAIQILAFIPDDKTNLRKQGDTLMLLADVAEGKKGIADLAPLLKLVEVKSNFTRRRFDAEELKALADKPKPEAENQDKTKEA